MVFRKRGALNTSDNKDLSNYFRLSAHACIDGTFAVPRTAGSVEEAVRENTGFGIYRFGGDSSNERNVPARP